MQSHLPENQKKWAKVIAKAWSDPAFKERLVKNPQAVLAEQGLNLSWLPKGTQIEIHENTSTTLHLVLPLKPNRVLSEDEMMRISAGSRCVIHACDPDGCAATAG